MPGVFRTPDDRFENLPGFGFKPRYAEVEGLRMHYVDEGSGDPIVLFHGEPTWSYLYRKMIGPLAERCRVIAPDFIGFGRSDKPTDRAAYTYDSHCRWISALLGELDLSRATVVVQDWGGPIGLRWAVENADRVARLVLLNTGIRKRGQTMPPAFMAWRSFAERTPDLPIGFVIRSATKTDVPEDVLAAYDAPFPTVESKAGAAQFPLLVPLTDDDPGAREMDELLAALGRWRKPALVAFGDSDPIFPPNIGERLADLIPGSGPMVTIEGASHFLQEDCGERVAEEILRFAGGE